MLILVCTCTVRLLKPMYSLLTIETLIYGLKKNPFCTNKIKEQIKSRMLYLREAFQEGLHCRKIVVRSLFEKETNFEYLLPLNLL